MPDPGDLIDCPDCGGSGHYHGGRCSLCQGKGGLNWRTGESVPAADVPPWTPDNDFEGKE